MNKFIEKAKDFGKKHKKGLTIFGVGTGLVIAFIAGEKYALDKTQGGIDIIDKAGLMDFKILRDDGNYDVVSQKEFCSWLKENRDTVLELSKG